VNGFFNNLISSTLIQHCIRVFSWLLSFCDHSDAANSIIHCKCAQRDAVRNLWTSFIGSFVDSKCGFITWIAFVELFKNRVSAHLVYPAHHGPANFLQQYF
jgi:hypothetical protein